jgi:hypothetical protein
MARPPGPAQDPGYGFQTAERIVGGTLRHPEGIAVREAPLPGVCDPEASYQMRAWKPEGIG